MMGKSIFLHIGLSKTGSSSIQKTLHRSRKLLIQQKIDYVPVGFWGWAHHNLAFQVREDSRFHNELKPSKKFKESLGTWQTLQKYLEASTAESFIISSEGFGSLQFNEIAKIFKHLGGYDTKVVIYVRNQLDMASSNYRQILNTHDFPLRQHFYHSLENEMYKFNKVVENWASFVGLENIHIRVFENCVNDVTNDFLKIIGATSLLGKQSAFENVSRDLRTLKLVQKINAKFPKSNPDYSKQRKESLQACLEYAEAHGWNDNRSCVFSRRQAKKLLSHFESSNHSLESVVGSLPACYYELEERYFSAKRLSPIEKIRVLYFWQKITYKRLISGILSQMNKTLDK
ncbi:MAG: hypothetical protein F6K11_37435 [Leptolyngbya sp. SIO3F4]|nr:hypothetical protein [Leptolyngbya sp. SIO3F4]